MTQEFVKLDRSQVINCLKLESGYYVFETTHNTFDHCRIINYNGYNYEIYNYKSILDGNILHVNENTDIFLAKLISTSEYNTNDPMIPRYEEYEIYCPLCKYQLSGNHGLYKYDKCPKCNQKLMW